MLYHVLDVRAIWIKEFASALARQVPVLGWLPRLSLTGAVRQCETAEELSDPRLGVRWFPLQRGFAREPLRWLGWEDRRVAARLATQSPDPKEAVLVCCAPHYAGVAERWAGPVVYYVTDLFVAYGERPERIRALERRICGRAELVCPNSQRIAEQLVREAGCDESRVLLLPNATRNSNLLAEPAQQPAALPADVADLCRPVAGVIGNLAANTDWVLLRETVERTPWLSWVFVGPTEMPVPESDQRASRDYLKRHRGRVRFTGAKPYGCLKDYARALDVAVLPYRKREPTYSGSATRFYEHVAACRPMLATKGFEELLHKEPLLKLMDTGDQMVSQLEQLRDIGFRDGYERLRWVASQTETWDARAGSMTRALGELLIPAKRSLELAGGSVQHVTQKLL